MKNVLITGGTGFIGSHLVERNLKEGNAVRILARKPSPVTKTLESRGVNIVYGDVCDCQSVEKAVDGIDVVFHLAAVVTDWAPKKLFHRVNIEGTSTVCDAFLKSNLMGKFVYVSTNDVFGVRKCPEIDETLSYRYWGEPYPDTKIDATDTVWEYYKKGLDVSVAYPCWVYGPGDRTFVPLLADAIRKNAMLFWKKESLFYPSYVENVVDLLMVIADHPKATGEGFLVHDGVCDTLQQFSARIAAAIGTPAPGRHIPYWAAYGAAGLSQTFSRLLGKGTRPLLTTYTVRNFASGHHFSIKKAERLLGWKPPVSYTEGLQKTIGWLKNTDSASWKQK